MLCWSSFRPKSVNSTDWYRVRENCSSFPGVIQSLTSKKWILQHMCKELGFRSCQKKTCSLYSLQGTTASPGLIADFTAPNVLYLIVCVLLSRVRKLDDLISIGLITDSIRNIIEGRPSDDLVGTFP